MTLMNIHRPRITTCQIAAALMAKSADCGRPQWLDEEKN
jgi:hypothetical protein